MAIALGAAAIVVFLVGPGALVAWRLARRDWVAVRPVARPVPPLSPAAALGVHWTTAASPGPAATAARSALVAALVGATAVVGVITFAGSLSHFLDTDRLYGWEFQGSYIGDSDDPSQLTGAVDRLKRSPDVTGIARGEILRLGIGGAPIESWALESVKGAVTPTLLTGRAPTGANEIVLGKELLERLHTAVGRDVEVKGTNGGGPFRVVGTAVFPELGNVATLSTAALVTSDATDAVGGEHVHDIALIRGRDAERLDKVMEENSPEGYEKVMAFQPPRVQNMNEVGSIPWLMAAFFAALALAAVAHALFLSVRHRRRDMAVLRSLGILRRQLRGAVTAQAATTVVVGAVVGIPLGVAVGRLAWGAIASGLGVLNRPVVNLIAVAAVVVGGMVAAIGVALVPARRAARLRPAQLLRTE